ncbi:MAG: hypothetical protein D6731_05315 [Planctomycetota bacterium]|nr:MAG: hypothetical protein D6731_05315 [Planctomycetota bacterium]
MVLVLARALVRHPGKAILIALACSLVGGGLASRLRLDTNRLALIGDQHTYSRGFRRFQEQFADVDAMVVVLGGAPEAGLPAAADALARRVAKRRDVFVECFARFPSQAPRGKALLFLTPQALDATVQRLRAGKAAVAALFENGLGGFFSCVAGEARALGEGVEAAERGRHTLALLEPFVGGLARALAGEAPGPEPWEGFVPREDLPGDPGGYVHTRDGRLVVLVQPERSQDLSAERRAVSALRELLGDLAAEFPGLEPGLTGQPVLEVDEYQTYRNDAALASAVALLAVTALFAVASRRLLGPLLALLCLLVAVACTLGVASLWPGHLNLISAAFCALMAGLGVDYAVHLVSRYDEERARGLPALPALRASLARTGHAVAGAAATTALAFLATLFSDVAGIREFGFVAAVGIVFCVLVNLFLLPALLVVVDRWRGGERRPRADWPRARFAVLLDRVVEERPGGVLAACLALALASLVLAWPRPGGAEGSSPSGLRYDANLLRLQAAGLPSVRLAEEVLRDPSVGGMFAAVLVHDRSHLARVQRALEALPSVGETLSLRDVLGDQRLKLERIADLRAELAGLEPLPRARAGGERERLARAQAGAEELVGALEQLARGTLLRGATGATDALLRLQEGLEAVVRAARTEGATARLIHYEDGLRRRLRAQFERLREECAVRPLRDEDLPPAIRERFVGRDGTALIRVYPREDVWEHARLERFLAEVRSVVSDVGGVPVQLYESERLLRRGVLRAAEIAAVFVLMYLLVHFRGFARPFAVGATLVVGFAWTAGLLTVCGVGLNPANLLALPLVLGIGIDYALHLVHRDAEARGRPSLAGAPALVATSTGRGVTLSAVTSIAGFGALGFVSAHRGLASIGWTLCLAVAACLAAALLFCPALLRLYAGPSRPLPLEGLPGPKTGPGGAPRKPAEDPPPPGPISD